MTVDTGLEELIRGLELRLLDPEVRASHAELDHLLTDDFLEIGSSGRIFDKRQVMEALLGGSDTSFTLEEYHLREVGDKALLATFHVLKKTGQDGEETSSIRSSLWVLQDGRWRLRFHQGTPSSTR